MDTRIYAKDTFHKKLSFFSTFIHLYPLRYILYIIAVLYPSHTRFTGKLKILLNCGCWSTHECATSESSIESDVSIKEKSEGESEREKERGMAKKIRFSWVE